MKLAETKEQIPLSDVDHYAHNYYCVNCGKHFNRWIKKGTPVRHAKAPDCPKCGCAVEP